MLLVMTVFSISSKYNTLQHSNGISCKYNELHTYITVGPTGVRDSWLVNIV